MRAPPSRQCRAALCPTRVCAMMNGTQFLLQAIHEAVGHDLRPDTPCPRRFRARGSGDLSTARRRPLSAHHHPPAHLRAALPSAGGGRAGRRRPHLRGDDRRQRTHRSLGSALRASGRRSRRDHRPRASGRRPLQYSGAWRRACARPRRTRRGHALPACARGHARRPGHRRPQGRPAAQDHPELSVQRPDQQSPRRRISPGGVYRRPHHRRRRRHPGGGRLRRLPGSPTRHERGRRLRADSKRSSPAWSTSSACPRTRRSPLPKPSIDPTPTSRPLPRRQAGRARRGRRRIAAGTASRSGRPRRAARGASPAR